MLRAVGRLLHVDDAERIETYRELLRMDGPPDFDQLDHRRRRMLRMLVGSLTTLGTSGGLGAAIAQLWEHPQVRSELIEMLSVLPDRIEYRQTPLDAGGDLPLHVHARYTRTEMLAAFDVGKGARPPTWQTGVWWEPTSRTDLFAFTLDKSVGGFSPTTRYRDYAISPELIHWESQSATSVESETGERYINHRERGTRILLFARLRVTDRAFWCLGPATYVCSGPGSLDSLRF